jgi:hypothetical protein
VALDLNTAKGRADDAVADLLVDPVCLAWFDRAADREGPAQAGECHEACATPGYVDDAVSRGAELRVVVDGGAYVFCCRPIGELAE